jgi:hypothetical protein
MFQKDLGSLLDKAQRVGQLCCCTSNGSGWHLVPGTRYMQQQLHAPWQLVRSEAAPAARPAPEHSWLSCLPPLPPQVEALVRPLAAAAGLEAAADVAVAAAHLAKADLATSTVMEMTALAGTMGRHYALKQGLEQQVRGGCWVLQPTGFSSELQTNAKDCYWPGD